MDDELPLVSDTDFTERQGVNEVARIVNSARCIWRETVHRDIGIDGHIEYVTAERKAPGRLVAVQVKAWPTAIDAAAARPTVTFSPKPKHRNYWSSYPLPVVVVMYHPGTSEMIWLDVRAALRAAPVDTLRIARDQRFDKEAVLECLSIDGPLPVGEFDVEAVAREMAQADPRAGGLSLLHLFTQGMTDLCNAVWFGMDLASEIVDALSTERGFTSFDVGESEFALIDRYVAFLIAYDLARVDFSTWTEALTQRQMVGQFLAPLTARGRRLRDFISAIDSGLGVRTAPYDVAIQERFVHMLVNPTGHDELLVRQRRIERVRQILA